MHYNLDLSKISIDMYKKLLKQQNLLPGRRILWENIDDHFSTFQQLGLNNVEELRKALSTPQKFASFVEKSGVSPEYLTILKREMGSLEQKPVLLSDFPAIPTEKIVKLAKTSVTTSREYFENFPNPNDELYCLCDLVRVNGIGPIAARAFYEAGYQSVNALAEGNPEEMLERISKVNAEKGYYKASLGVKDMQFCIDFARLLNQFSS